MKVLSLIYAMLIFKHSNWLKNLRIQSECFKTWGRVNLLKLL